MSRSHGGLHRPRAALMTARGRAGQGVQTGALWQRGGHSLAHTEWEQPHSLWTLLLVVTHLCLAPPKPLQVGLQLDRDTSGMILPCGVWYVVWEGGCGVWCVVRAKVQSP